jgi:hypothetical protein
MVWPVCFFLEACFTCRLETCDGKHVMLEGPYLVTLSAL